MNRQTFIETACIAGIRPQENAATQRHHAKALQETAAALADALGLKDEEARSTGDVPPWARTRIHELEARVAELEAQLEQLTAPATKGRKA